MSNQRKHTPGASATDTRWGAPGNKNGSPKRYEEQCRQYHGSLTNYEKWRANLGKPVKRGT